MNDRRSSAAIVDLGAYVRTPTSPTGMSPLSGVSQRSGPLVGNALQPQAAFQTGHPSLRPIGRFSLLEWTVKRLANSSLLDAILITGSPGYSKCVERLQIEPARWLPSESKTPVERCFNAAKLVQANWIVLVQNNCPFVDPILVDRLVAAAWATPNSDMISFVSSARPTSSLRGLGLVAEVCHRRALRRLAGRIDANDQRDVSQLIHSMPELFHARCLPLPAALDREGLRWTLETEDDWDKAHMLLDSRSESIDYSELANMAIHCNTSRLLRAK
jgi:spore coat polysaccharide biosynthesis protein SpsF